MLYTWHASVTSECKLQRIHSFDVFAYQVAGHCRYPDDDCSDFATTGRCVRQGPMPDYKYGAFVRSTADGTDEELSPFRSISFSIWWVCTTMTTVGYGDFFPTTTLGRIVAVLLYYVGILTIALPVTVFGSHFTTFYDIWITGQQDANANADADTDKAESLEHPAEGQAQEQEQETGQWRRQGGAGAGAVHTPTPLSAEGAYNEGAQWRETI